MRTVYLDNAASTRADESVMEAIRPYFTDNYAVATSVFSYTMGLKSKRAIDSARKIIAEKISSSSDEIIFTSGETESNNIAILGLARANKDRRHIITTETENLSILKPIEKLKEEGFSVSYIPVDNEGFIDCNALEKSIKKETLMITICHANEEIGTMQDIERISKICKEKKIFFHLDATQTFTKMSIDVKRLNITTLTLSSHTIHGPKGVGSLFIRKGTKIEKIMHGGFNEFDMRPGIENVPAIVGFGKVVQISEKDCKKISDLRDYLIERITKEIPDIKINGPLGGKRLCNNVNISFRHVEGESILLRLDMKGICVSTGSACFSRSLEMSPTMKAIGNNHELSHGSIRFTLSKYTTKEEIDYTVESLKKIIKELRKISPLGKG
ncbi:MAG TPA: cysteine desulfurase [bacterium]|nr:cysteine desulfurase [bacterium]